VEARSRNLRAVRGTSERLLLAEQRRRRQDDRSTRAVSDELRELRYVLILCLKTIIDEGNFNLAGDLFHNTLFILYI